MKFSAFTASTPDWTPEEAAQTLAAQGWDGIEWRITDQVDAATPGFWAGNRATWPLTNLEANLERIGLITAGAGLEFSALGGYARCDNHADVERLLSATARLGARQVRVTTPWLGTSRMGGGEPSGRSYPDLFAETRQHFVWIAERAAHHGVKALVELHHQSVISSASAALRLLEGLDPRHVGVIHDLGNLVIEGQEENLAALQMLGDFLAHVHVKNVRWVRSGTGGDGVLAGTVTWSHEWATLRAGQASVADYFRSLAAVGYDGWVTVEDFSTELPLSERTADNLAFLKAVEVAVRTAR
jgi:sugar phosphate isomerase/epimerase